MKKKYNTKDIQKVYQAVIKKIAKDYLPLGKNKNRGNTRFN